MELETKDVKQAYLYLKSYTYQENLNLFLKQRVAKFECESFDSSIEKIVQVLKSEAPLDTEAFKKWLSEIDYHLIPKTVIRPEEETQGKGADSKKEGLLYISNVKTSKEYKIKANYFINAPVELHIIDVLWCLVVGAVLEDDLTRDCYGNRMHEPAKKFKNPSRPNQTQLFKYYIDQYNEWRDKAINTAIELSKSKEDVAVLSLDLKSYFYHIDLDFNLITDRIERSNKGEWRDCALMLTRLLEKIFSKYSYRIRPFLTFTHNDCKDKRSLPIGFTSSSILANWYLVAFDKAISDDVRPVYYGRYVDDILMVFKRPKVSAFNEIASFIEHYFPNLLNKGTKEGLYTTVIEKNELPIQEEKIIFQYFNKEHSPAGLEVFKQELEENSSAFKFLPTDHIDKDLNKFAYDILYDGSANKFRSVIGLAENEAELSKYLTNHIIAHRLCKSSRNDSILQDLSLFFKGKNALRFSRIWEKVYQYAVVIGDNNFIIKFFEDLENEIEKVYVVNVSAMEHSDDDKEKQYKLTEKLKEDLQLYNQLSLALTMALLGTTIEDISLFRSMSNIKNQEKLKMLIKKLNPDLNYFRRSNLIRDKLVAWPLANYSDFKGDLTKEESIAHPCHKKLDPKKLELTPRFIHFDEWQIFHLLNTLSNEEDLMKSQQDSLKKYKKRCFGEIFPVSYSEKYDFCSMSDLQDEESIESGKIYIDVEKKAYKVLDLSNVVQSGSLQNIFLSENLFDPKLNEGILESISKAGHVQWEPDKSVAIETRIVTIGEKPKTSALRIALANLRINEKDIENAIRNDQKPNISFKRQKNLYQILNDAVREGVHLLLMPEVSIPVSWLPFMVAHARRHQLAIIFGLEHWVIGENVYNLLIEALPFKISGKYKSCAMLARLKNHYAPEEISAIRSLRLKPANNNKKKLPKPYYHKVKWNGISFATYNCFELSDIEHRTLFKSKIDILFACVWNKDTNYYEHILESAVRDLHCYVVQSNTAQYGGSCVLKPAKTEHKTMLYVKGGNNTCILTVDLDIEALRKFQYQSEPNEKDEFKHLPPGFNSKEVLDR
ncbi:MAG: hypothetical protein K0R48_46 [Gammaproteobacteria bacterium]|jgi:hypothetical protein|nr:hypothetical protein [Gammaproteobacteria bacterium]